MFVFKNRRHKNTSEPVLSEIIPEEQKELDQLQNLLIRRKKSSQPKSSLIRQTDSTQNFKEALYTVIEKRKKKLAKRNRSQTCETKIEGPEDKFQSDCVSEISKVNEQAINTKASEGQPLEIKKSRKKKAKPIESSASEISLKEIESSKSCTTSKKSKKTQTQE